MIPSVADILDGLLSGRFTKDNALAYMMQHIALAYESGKNSEAMERWIAENASVDRGTKV